MEVNIAYSFDDNFAQHGGCSLLSLLMHNQDIETINIYIIDDHIGDGNKKKLDTIARQYKRQITYLNLEEVTKDLKVKTVFSRCSYGRLFLSQLEHIDKILYFDSDTIILSSIKELWEDDMEGYFTAGVQDTVNPFFVHQVGLNDSDRYINAGGVIALNLKLWREYQLSYKCISFIEEHQGNPPHHDQGTLNYVSRGRVKILAPKYNVMNPFFLFTVNQIHDLFHICDYYTQQDIDSAKENPSILHFTAEIYNRPWFENCTHPYKEEYRKILRLSPWQEQYPYKEMTKNCKIQNFVYHHCPYFVYKMMVRFIEFKHSVRK